MEPLVHNPAPSLGRLQQLLNDQPIPDGTRYTYGTAGFRMAADLLGPIMVRVGLAAAQRSSTLQAAIGVMITASHNPTIDNGVKIADPNGGMMAEDGETAVMTLVHAPMEELLAQLPLEHSATVHIGRDTREHSESLAELVVDAARAAGARVIDHGEITTPCLHHCVLHDNTTYLPPVTEPHPHESGYYRLLAQSYSQLLLTSPSPMPTDSLLVDCACGIGYLALRQLVVALQRAKCMRRIVASNRPFSGPLNGDCGSEHVQKQQRPPVWYNTPPIDHGYCAALDGDADRIVFFSETNGFVLFDGDKIAALICGFLQGQLADVHSTVNGLAPLRLGVVQTAYANGASTAYLRQLLGEEAVAVAATGVKHVHKKAHEFDIGVYFEANGHGTILFDCAFYDYLAMAKKASVSCQALERLSLLPLLVNQAIGDALSDLLLVDTILQIQGYSLADWNALYTDLPSCQVKVRVKDRSMVQTNESETKCVSPIGVQDELDKAAAELDGRTFVRPSGTEDVVRVYAEAPLREDAKALAVKACEIVYRLCGGVGGLPSL